MNTNFPGKWLRITAEESCYCAVRITSALRLKQFCQNLAKVKRNSYIIGVQIYHIPVVYRFNSTLWYFHQISESSSNISIFIRIYENIGIDRLCYICYVFFYTPNLLKVQLQIVLFFRYTIFEHKENNVILFFKI